MMTTLGNNELQTDGVDESVENTRMWWLDKAVECSERFWSKVDIRDSVECWNWTRCTRTIGYGVFRVTSQVNGQSAHKNIAAHQVAYRIANGRFDPSAFVLHACDNAHCVSPFHLYLGDVHQNTRDRVLRGRGATGSRHGFNVHPELRPRGDKNGSRLHPESRPRGEKMYSSTLTEDIVRKIRSLSSSGASPTSISREMGLGISSVRHVVKGRSWRHIR